jgi:3-phytase
MRSLSLAGVLTVAVLSGCSSLPNPAAGLFSGGARAAPPAAPVAGLVPLAERFVTPADGVAVTAVAYWGRGGNAWLIAAAADAGQLQVRDATTGQLLRTIGGAEAGPGPFQYPHRLAVVGDLLLVVERDAPRVQVLSLPDFTPLTQFGDGEPMGLIRPQGVWAQPMSGWGYHVYVADDYQDVGGQTLDDASLQRRIKQYALSDSAVGWTARGIRTFGEREGEGRLLRVDALLGDAAQDRLLIADAEVTTARRLKAYALNGRYAGRTTGGGVFRSAVGGLALLQCRDGGGHWIAADAGANGDYLHLFDRQTLDYRASFAPQTARQFSALALSGPLPGAPQGLLYAVQADGRIAAFDLATALTAARLKACAD